MISTITKSITIHRHPTSRRPLLHLDRLPKAKPNRPRNIHAFWLCHTASGSPSTPPPPPPRELAALVNGGIDSQLLHVWGASVLSAQLGLKGLRGGKKDIKSFLLAT